MRHLDKESLLKQQVEQYKLNEFRAKSQLGQHETPGTANFRNG